MNNYPLKTYLFILVTIVMSVVYALPNLFAADPALQISGQNGEMVIDQPVMDKITNALRVANIENLEPLQ